MPRSGDVTERELAYVDLDEFRQSLPSTLYPLHRGIIVPCGEKIDENKNIVIEARRYFLGEDQQLYVVHFRDTYRRRLLGRNELLSEEAALVYKGKKIRDAVKAMNEGLEKLNDYGPHSLTTFTVGRVTAARRGTHAPYTVKEVVSQLNKRIDHPKNEVTQKVLKQFDLEL